MRAIDYIEFDISGWNLLEVKKTEKRWVDNSSREYLSLHLFIGRPDFASNLSNLDTLREQSQQALVPLKGEIVEIRADTLDTIPSFRQIIKLPQPHGGYVYIASYTIPFQQSSYIIKIQSAEHKAIGKRETSALEQLIAEGELDLDLDNPNLSPADFTPEIENRISVTSDSTEYDMRFPDHPLSRVRQSLDSIQNTIRLHAILKQQTPFQYESKRTGE